MSVTIHLLDVNVLLALSDPVHAHHRLAHRWFDTTGRVGWATCPLTENGFVRVASHPSYPNRPGDASMVLGRLRAFCSTAGHHFWTADMSLRDLLSPGAVFTHAQITDVYLLGLAVQKGGNLATLDRRISPDVIAGGRDALVVIPT